MRHALRRAAPMLLCLACASAGAQGTPESFEKSLNMIRDFAISMCANPEYRGSSTSVSAGASAKAEISKLLKKLADAKVELDAGAKREGFEGMLQKDLLEATKVASDCRLKIFNELKGRLLPPAPAAAAPTPAPAPAAALAPPAAPRPGPALAAVSPSFDCVRASNRAERLVCGSQALAVLDLSMANSYRDLMAEQGSDAARKALRDSQLGWLRQVRNPCPDEACLSSAYQARIDQLKQARR